MIVPLKKLYIPTPRANKTISSDRVLRMDRTIQITVDNSCLEDLKRHSDYDKTQSNIDQNASLMYADMIYVK